MPPARNKKGESNKISRYLLDEQLSEQPISVIFRATDEKTGEPVFLVTLRPEAATSDLADRFLRRSETAAQLKHDNILPVLDYGTDEKRPYAVLPYRPGQFLVNDPAFLAGAAAADKSQVLKALELVKQLAAALSSAHPTGLIHHDLRPENIYLDSAGKPFLLDLVIPPTPAAPTAAAAAHPRELDYQSPEQQAGKTLSGRSNVFSLGILLYRLLAGKLPPLPVSEWDIFEHKGVARETPLQELHPDLTQATYTAVQDSLWQKEWSRYETAADQQKALEKAITAEAAPLPPPPPAWLKFVRRLIQPKTLKMIVPAFIVLVLLILLLVWGRGRARRNQALQPTPDVMVLPAGEATVELPPPSAAATETEPVPEMEFLPTATQPPTATFSPPETAVASPSPESPPTETAQPEPALTVNATATANPTEAISCVPSPPFGWVRYAIQANDSLSAIGQATNTTVEQLQEVNCLDSTLLSVGQEIWVRFVPNATATPTAVPETAVIASPTAPAKEPPAQNATSTPPPEPTTLPQP